jgi:hypothetical protein
MLVHSFSGQVSPLTVTVVALTAILMVSIERTERALYGVYLSSDCSLIAAWIVRECTLAFASDVDGHLILQRDQK